VELWIVLGAGWLLAAVIGGTSLGRWLQPHLFLNTLSLMTVELTIVWVVAKLIAKRIEESRGDEPAP